MSTHSSETPTTQPLDHNQSIDSPSVASTTLPPAPVSPKQSPRRRGKYISLFIVALLICSAGGFAGGGFEGIHPSFLPAVVHRTGGCRAVLV